ncbi:MAG: DUF5110 domain-containing protein [Prevotella sp.]|nr:DUF5110 domain-containing protein [Prevotella sp.]
MKRSAFIFLSLWALGMQAQTVTETPNGVRVVPSDGNTTTTEIVFYSPTTVRVMKYSTALAKAPEHKSYSIIAKPEKLGKQLVTTRTSDAVSVKSENMSVSVDLGSGNVSFFSEKSEHLIRETGSKSEVIDAGVDQGKYKISQTWQLDKDEVILGLGQVGQQRVNQRGQDIQIWCTNGYISIPYFSSEKGYGLYWDNAGESRFTDNESGTTFRSSVAEMEDYYLMYKDGTQDGVIAAIRQLTGQATMFPLWAMGHWQCRERYKSSDELCDVLDKYRELQIPLDGIVQDWQYWGCDSNWNAMDFMNPHYINKMGDPKWMRYLPNDENPKATYPTPRIKTPQEMVQYVHDHHAHLMISIWASFGPWTKQYAELEKIHALLPFDTWPRNRGVMPYDPFNPEARNIYWKYLRNLYGMGFDAWWTDSTEPDHFEKDGDRDYMTFDGSFRSVKNAYSMMTNRGIYEHQRATKGNNKRSIQMTRSGAFGIQHYGTFSWSGDITSNWQTMKRQIPSGLNYVACGIPFWNTDLGGFFGWDYNNDPKSPAMQELQVRWMQWGAFMPLMRNHCSSPMVSEIYNFGKPGDWAYDAMKEAVELRYRLLPYIYSNAGDVVLHSGSMMRPLLFDFSHDRKAMEVNDEYLFGRNLLVKPVTDPLYTWKSRDKKGHEIYPDVRKAAAPVDVYLPAKTDWWDLWTNERQTGGQTIQRLAPIDVIPVYVRAGSILPWGPAVQYSNEKPWDNLDIRVYPGADGDFTLYEDEGDNYNYEKGRYSLIQFHWDEASQTLSVAARKGSFVGMLKQRAFQVKLIGTDMTKTINYDGASTKVTF